MIDAEKREGMDAVFKSLRPRKEVSGQRAVELCALLIQKADTSEDKKEKRRNLLMCASLSEGALSCVAKDEDAELYVDQELLENAESATEGMVLSDSPISDAFERVAKSAFGTVAKSSKSKVNKSEEEDDFQIEADRSSNTLEDDDEGWDDPDIYSNDLNEMSEYKRDDDEDDE